MSCIKESHSVQSHMITFPFILCPYICYASCFSIFLFIYYIFFLSWPYISRPMLRFTSHNSFSLLLFQNFVYGICKHCLKTILCGIRRHNQASIQDHVLCFPYPSPSLTRIEIMSLSLHLPLAISLSFSDKA